MTPQAMQQLINLSIAGEIPVFLTGEEGQELVALGLIQPDATQPGIVPGSCRVSITEVGAAVLKKESKPVVSDIRSGVLIPDAAPRGNPGNLGPRKSNYKFNDLGEPTGEGETLNCPSFHVAVSPTNPTPWKSMASNVSAANKRSEVEVLDDQGNVVMENTIVRTMIRGDDKKALLDANGKRQYDEVEASVVKMVATKKFLARRVNKDDPDGEGVRVFRVPLNY